MHNLDDDILFSKLKTFIQNNKVTKYIVRQNINKGLVLSALSYPKLVMCGKTHEFYYLCSCAEIKKYSKEDLNNTPVITYGDTYDIEGIYFVALNNKEIVRVNLAIDKYKPC